MTSEQITKGIDLDDTDFVVLTKFSKAALRTGDKVLYNGLKRLEFKKLINTTELLALRTTKSVK